MHEDVADAMRSAADQSLELARRTPHRVMRELYLQAIAYWRAYADAIPTYTEPDNSLAVVTTDLAGAIVSICAAVDYGSAKARGPLVQVDEAPDSVATDINVTSPEMFMSTDGDLVCHDWSETSRKFDSDVAEWHAIDPNLDASQWTPEQREVMRQSVRIMNKFAADLKDLGARSKNPIVKDFAALSAAYWVAFTASVESYTTTDSYLSATANYTNFAVYYACEAVGN